MSHIDIKRVDKTDPPEPKKYQQPNNSPEEQSPWTKNGNIFTQSS